MSDRKIDLEKPYEINIGDSIWTYKQWRVSSIGGIIVHIPKPNPRYFSVFGLVQANIKVNDFILVARDNSNNKRYSMIEENGVLRAVEIKDGLIGRVKSITGNRVEVYSELLVDGTQGHVGWPKPLGAVVKIIGYDNEFVDEKLSDRVSDAKKLHGTNWREKTDRGAWLSANEEKKYED